MRAPSSRTAQIFPALARWATQIATALLAGGLSVRLTIRDSIPGLSAIYYATPWPILTAAALFPAILWARRRRWPIAAGFLFVALVCGAAWVRNAFHFHKPTGTATIRVAYWNTCRPGSELPAALDLINSIHADIFGLAETNSKVRNIHPRPEWATGQPGKQILHLRRHMLLATPQPTTQLHDGLLNDRGQYALTQTELHGRKILILMADFDAIIAWSRKPAFDRLIQLIDAIGDQPLIVMGDFNTPLDSTFFAPLRARLRHTFETAGSGYAKTWPMPLPVLDIDHIWVSHHFRIVHSEHRSSLLSDHRPVIADLEF